MAAKKTTATLQPNLGLYYDRARLAMSPRMLADGLNFRVKEGRLTNINLGYNRFGTFTLNGPVMMIKNFVIRGGSEQLVFATFTDLYRYVNDTTVVYLTPRYETGTVGRSGSTVTLVGGLFQTNNVKTGDEIYFGATGQNAPAAAWHTITVVTDETHLTTSDSGTVSTGTAYTIRKKFTGAISNTWQNDIFVNASPSTNDELWITNGLDNIVRWDGISTQAEQMSALGFTAKTLFVANNMMIFANLTQGGTRKPTDMINSNPGEPQNVSSGLSEQFKIHGKVDEILRGMVLGDNLVFYSYTNDGAITLAQFVGSPLVFVFRQVTSSVGSLAGKAIADFGNYHEFLANDGQYYFDGATIKAVNKHVWRELLRTQDPGRISISYAHFDEENGDLIWVFPTTADPNSNGGPAFASVEHYMEDPGVGLPSPFSRRSFPFVTTGYFKRQTGLTWNQITDQWQNVNFRWNDRFFFASFPLNLGGTFDGKIFSVNTSQDADGAALPSFVTFGRRVLSDGRMRGLVSRVYPFVSTFTTPLNVTVQLSDSADGEPMILDTQSFDQTQPEGKHFTVHYRRGRFFEVKFSTNGPAQPYSIAGYDTDHRKGGKR